MNVTCTLTWKLDIVGIQRHCYNSHTDINTRATTPTSPDQQNYTHGMDVRCIIEHRSRSWTYKVNTTRERATQPNNRGDDWRTTGPAPRIGNIHNAYCTALPLPTCAAHYWSCKSWVVNSNYDFNIVLSSSGNTCRWVQMYWKLIVARNYKIIFCCAVKNYWDDTQRSIS